MVFSDELLWCENFDLGTIVTPVDANRLDELLKVTKYPDSDREFLVDGFRNGFELGYRGPTERQTLSKNHKLRAGNPVVLWNKIMKEVGVGRMTGPHEWPPYESFIQSPITLIKKKGSESSDPLENTHLIFDLSAPHGNSLNDHTPQELKSVKYPLFDKAITMCLEQGESCYLSKTDCKSAFLMLPLRVDQFKWVVMMCPHPISGKKYYFCLKTLCFGSGTSCFLYMKLSNALAHIFRHLSGGDICNLLDDFLTCKLDREGCDAYLRVFIKICSEINLPLSDEKTCWSTQVIVFLGLMIDTIRQMVTIPLDKIERGLSELDVIIRSKKITVHQLQKLTGLLNFFCRAVVPGRAFTRRLYAKGVGLRQHHHIRVDKEMRNDCLVWFQFLEMSEAVSRPFLDFTQMYHADILNYYTDGALDPFRIGVGGRFQDRWFSGTISLDDLGELSGSVTIQMVELYAIVLSLSIWIELLRNRRVVLFCDNEAVVHMINKSTSSCKVCMIMLRMIVLWSMKFNTRVFCFHVRSSDNTDADLLSRERQAEFLWRNQSALDLPDELPKEIWPIPLEWLK